MKRTDSLISDRVTAHKCRANYGNYRNVVGVSVGSKFSGGKRLKGSKCVQFFVSEKTPERELRRCLPKFVHPRADDGTVNRYERLRTDVIELRNLRLCCGAGSKVARVGGNGTVTLMFRDQSAGSSAVYAITCAHVISDLQATQPPNAIVVGGTDNCVFIGDIVGGTTLNGDTLEYDVGLIEVRDPDTTFDYLGVTGRPASIAGIAEASEIELNDVYECAFPISGETQATVDSLATTLEGVDVGGASINIQNLIAAKGEAQPGDSGGLLFHNDQAVGILVAQADGDWLFFQPLADALVQMKADIGVDFEVFGGG